MRTFPAVSLDEIRSYMYTYPPAALERLENQYKGAKSILDRPVYRCPTRSDKEPAEKLCESLMVKWKYELSNALQAGRIDELYWWMETLFGIPSGPTNQQLYDQVCRLEDSNPHFISARELASAVQCHVYGNKTGCIVPLLGWTLIDHTLVSDLASICMQRGRPIQEWCSGRGALATLLAYELKQRKSKLTVEALDTLEEGEDRVEIIALAQRHLMNLWFRPVRRLPQTDQERKQVQNCPYLTLDDAEVVRPDSSATLIVCWARCGFQDTIDEYFIRGGKCLVLIGEVDGCTMSLDHDYTKKFGLDVKRIAAPNHSYEYSCISVYSRK